jgi:hypothetical protein
MASGHMNRVKRPDTWLHRPMLQNVKKILANPEPSTHDPEETSPGRGTSRGEIRDPLLSDADRFYRGGSSFSAKSSPISIRWSLNLERTLRHF